MTTHILLVDDHPLFRDGMRHVLTQLSSTTHIHTAENCADALTQAQAHPELDLVLLDVNLADDSGMDCLALLRQGFPLLPVIMLSASEDAHLVKRALQDGAQGYITKSSTTQVMLNAIQLVLVGGIYVPKQALGESLTTTPQALDSTEHGARANLTPRQMEVLRLLARGDSNKEIARQLQMSDGTVRVHVTAILRALGVTNRTQAGLAATRQGLLSDQP